MDFRFLAVPVALLLLFVSSAIPASAHFFPNISSIPPSLNPNKTVWNGFSSFAGCKKGITADGLAKLKKYFHHFGYLNDSYDGYSDVFDDYLEFAVKNYQVNFNLAATGELDSKTLRHMVLPRCGNPDVVNGTSTMRSGRRSYSSNPAVHTVAHYTFFPDQPRWPEGQTRLIYAFLPENQLSDDVRSAFRRAFDRWSEVTPLTFTETTTFREAHIRIGFYTGDHGDGEPFDGVLGTLAHAFSPPSGRLHLDGDENWVIELGSSDPAAAVHLESVAVHEIGHLLGLGHSSVPEAIMYPTLSSGARKVDLARDDVTGIQVLYGSNPNYNASDPVWNENDTSGSAPRGKLQLWGWLLLAVGLNLPRAV